MTRGERRSQNAGCRSSDEVECRTCVLRMGMDTSLGVSHGECIPEQGRACRLFEALRTHRASMRSRESVSEGT